MTLFCMPFTLVNLLYEEWIFHPLLCPFVNFIQLMSVNGVVSMIVLLAINRYKAVKNPLKYKSNRSKTKTRLNIMVIWIISASLASIQLFIYKCKGRSIDSYNDDEKCYCQENWTNNKYKNPSFYGLYTCWIFFESYFIPVSAIIVTYSKIIIVLKKRSSNMESLCSTKRDSITILSVKKKSKKVRKKRFWF